MNNQLNSVLTEIYRTVGRKARESSDPDAEDHLQEALIASLELLRSNNIMQTEAYIGSAYRRNVKSSETTMATVAIDEVDRGLPSTAPDPECQAMINCKLRRIVRQKSRVDRSAPVLS